MIQGQQIIYDDKYIIAVEKPHGLQTEPDRMGNPDLCTELRRYLNKQNRPPKLLQPVNRLDRPVAGLVLFAKTATALKQLNEAQEKRSIKKTYVARTEGLFEMKEARLAHYLVKHNLEKKAYVYEEPISHSKPCILDYVVTDEDEHTSLLEIQLHTGRYHQIRAQMAYVGHPIVGDAYYGAKEKFMDNAICLHATRLHFSHPITGEELYLLSPSRFS